MRSLLLLVILAVGRPVSAEPIAAVLSSDLKPYREAFESFQRAWGRSVQVPPLRDGKVSLAPGTRLVVAFGGKAALVPYPPGTALIYCMAPTTVIGPRDRQDASIRISMVPRVEVVLGKLRELQPGLKRLAVIWSSDVMADYYREMQRAGSGMSLKVLTARMDGPDDLPGALRALGAKMDALWIPPDALLNVQSFTVLKEYSWSNGIPFYAPTEGLVEKGATASVAISYQEVGKAAAAAARNYLAGTPPPSILYPESAQISLNLTAAKKAGLAIPDEVVRTASKVFP